MISGLYYLNIYMHTNSTVYFKGQENKTLFLFLIMRLTKDSCFTFVLFLIFFFLTLENKVEDGFPHSGRIKTLKKGFCLLG